MRSRSLISSIAPLLLAALLVLAWELALMFFGVSRLILPRPSEISEAAWLLLRSGLLLRHTLVTASETLLGFVFGVVAAFLFGLPIAMSLTVERYVYPYILALQTLPKIAIAPLLIIWVGIGMTSKVIITAIIVLFPVLINLVAGARAFERSQIELLDVYKGDRLDQIIYVRIPTALPYIFAGLKTGAVLGLLGAVTGEFVGSTAGLGYLLTQQMNRLDTPGVFAVLLVLMILGLLLYLAMGWAERRLIYWRRAEPELLGHKNKSL